MSVKTNYGLIEGVHEDGYTIFKGVPYAKPPVGDLRFKAPEEPDAWEGVYQADRFPNRCPQFDWGDNADNPYKKEFYSVPEYIPPMSEDCLYLNIWAPDDAKDLPVAFWIHGGGFGGGTSCEMEFDGAAYAKKGVILVTINYRLNAFGFLAHPWLTAESEYGSSGNVGILDQIAALKFVRENIGAFGGDPENITIFGQSAGCMSCQVLLSSPLTRGMFKGAILQSGVTCEKEYLLTPTLAESEEFGKKLVELTCANSLEELRALPTEKILDAFGKFNGMMMASGKGLVIVPTIDGYVLPEGVRECWKNGNLPRLSYMVGCTGNDLGVTPEDLAANDPGLLLRECKAFAEGVSKNGSSAYVYKFMHKLPGDDWGAFHTAEVWYTFATLGRCWRPMTEEDFALSDRMVEAWTDFCKTGAPYESWRKYTAEDPYVESFD